MLRAKQMGKKVAAVSTLLTGCMEPPKFAEPLTEEDRILVDAHMERYDHLLPFYQELWKRSSVDFDMYQETVGAEESALVLTYAGEHFRALLEAGHVLVADTLESPTVATAKSSPIHKDSMKDYIVLNREASYYWDDGTFLHEAVHSLATSSARHTDEIEEVISTSESQEEYMEVYRILLEEKDIAYATSELVWIGRVIDWALIPPGLTDHNEVSGLSEYDGWRDLSDEEFATRVLELLEPWSWRLEGLGVSRQEMREVIENPEITHCLREWQTLAAERRGELHTEVGESQREFQAGHRL